MKRLFASALGFAAIIFTVAGCTGRPPVLNDDGWITLFDGTEESLSKNWDRAGTANWRLYRGAVMADAQTGKGSSFLVSKNNYTDFQLRVEFWASHDANSGIFIRLSDPKTITATNSYEVNIYDKRPDQAYRTGAIVDVAQPLAQINTGGKWNTLDITARGTRLIVVMNGTKTVDVDDRKFARGPLALQYSAGTVKFKNVRIRIL